MNLHALQHRMSPWDTYSLARNSLTIRMRAAHGDLNRCTMIYWSRSNPNAKQSAELAIVLSDDLFDYYETTLKFPSVAYYVKYCFMLEDMEGRTLYYTSVARQREMPQEGFFEHLYTNEGDVIDTPEWAKGIVYYQIFIDRFHRDPTYPTRHPLQAWGAKPDRKCYLGGNLRGIRQKLDYLSELGAECLYLTPVFKADFNHKYATVDYREIDADFGTLDDLKSLVSDCHERGIRILLDGVFNHCGIDFLPFRDVLEKQEASLYAKWFYIKRFPVTVSSDCYECVGNYQWMPKLNTSNREVREFILDIMRYWLRTANIDGWRLDVADEVDYRVWQYAHTELKEEFPNILLLGETWGDGGKMLSGRQLDSVMNYLFRGAALDFFARQSLDAAALGARLGSILARYHSVTNHLLYNPLDSHDTTRFLTECKGDKRLLRLAVAFQMLYIGCPAIYYGDETGMEGGDDPDSRRCMRWDKDEWDAEILEWYRRLIEIRKQQPAVRRGDFVVTLCDGDVFAFARLLPGEEIHVVFNRSRASREVYLPVLDAGNYLELLEGGQQGSEPFRPGAAVCGGERFHYGGSIKKTLSAKDIKLFKRLH